MLTTLLLILFPVAVQYERGGLWWLIAPVTFVALVIDVLANYTELALLTWDFPRRGEYTFSNRLRRLQYNNDWRGVLARPVVRFLNWIMPGHI